MAVDYKIEFRDVNDDFWRVWVKDMQSTNSTVTTLKAGTTSPLIIKSVNNDENKLAPVRAREIQFSYLNEGGVGVEIFSGDGPDDRWRVEVEHIPVGAAETILEFIGFLQLDDLNEPLRLPTNVVQLTASDGLGRLKNVGIKDFNGATFNGIYSLIKLMAMALKRTGLVLNINVCSSVKVVTSGGDKALFEFAFVDAKMFNSIAINSTNCYDVLSRILAGRFFVTQHAGEWYIMDVDDMDGSAMERSLYNSTGDYVSTDNIAWSAQLPYFISQAADRALNRPVKTVNTRYKIEVGDLLLNQEARKGDELPPPAFASGESIALTVYGEPDFDAQNYYNLEGWTLKQVNRTTYALSSPNAWTRIRRTFVYGSEWGREIVIYKPNSETAWNDYILENDAKIPIRRGDRLTFSLEARYGRVVDLNNPKAVACAQVLLFATSGQVYTLIYDTDATMQNKWANTTNTYNKEHYWRIPDIKASLQTPDPYGGSENHNGVRTWSSLTNAGNNDRGSNPAPEDGVIKIRLVNFTSEYYQGVIATLPTRYNTAAAAMYRNIKLEIKSVSGFITGNAQGWYYRAERSGVYNNKRDEDIAIDNATALIFDGCLLQTDGNANNLFGYAAISQVKTKSAIFYNYGAMIARTIWNQYNRVFETIRGNFSAAVKPAMVSLFSISGIANKKYLLLGYEWDVRAAQVTGAQLKEVHDVGIGKEAKTITREVVEPE